MIWKPNKRLRKQREAELQYQGWKSSESAGAGWKAEVALQMLKKETRIKDSAAQAEQKPVGRGTIADIGGLLNYSVKPEGTKKTNSNFGWLSQQSWEDFWNDTFLCTDEEAVWKYNEVW